MKLGSKKAWKSVVPRRLRGKSATRFCFLPKAKSVDYGPGCAPVYLNVYDLTPMNGYVYWAGLGIFHSGVEGKPTLFNTEFIKIITSRCPFGLKMGANRFDSGKGKLHIWVYFSFTGRARCNPNGTWNCA